ncbi:MAG: hypothetical protein ACPGWR_11980 [Ardenticatenaceae bacterium]
MSTSTLTRPISIEQIAEAIKQMSQSEIQRLLDLVPKLRSPSAAKPRRTRTLKEAQASVDALDAELMTVLNHKPLTGNEPLLAGLTLNQYLALPDEEESRLWDEWAQVDIMEMEEQEVSANVLSAR